MKGRLLDLSVGRNGKQRLTVEIDDDFRQSFDDLQSSDLEIAIKKWKARRSNDANALFHLLVNEIARARQETDTEVKNWLVTEYGVLARDADGNFVGCKMPPSVNIEMFYPYTRLYKTVTENGKEFNCYLFYKRTRDLDTSEMSKLIDGTIYEAKELGIDTDTPAIRERFSSYMDNYGRRL